MSSHARMRTALQLLDRPFRNLEPPDREVGGFYVVQERCAADFEASDK